ncbi:MAG: CopG family transcriptional regulator [Elusimicrobiota bacterium]
MKSKIKYTEEPMGELRVVKDFLPPPEDISVSDEKVKVTVYLNKSNVDFFKRKAQKYHTKYQTMICNLLNTYALR